MGLFRFVNALIFHNAVKKSIKEQQEKDAAYLKLSTAELSCLSDDELFCAAVVRAQHAVDAYEDMAEGIHALSREQQVLYGLNYLDCEVNNGGLCQFFVNSSRVLAPMISGYMETVGAVEHKKLYDGFLKKHRIDVSDLSSFDSRSAEEFEAQYDRYPFDEYDDAFYETEPLETYLIPFIKANLDKF